MKVLKPINSRKGAIARIIFCSIWLAVALLLFFLGLSLFIEAADRGFGDWLVFGIMCCFPVIGTVIKTVVKGAKSGWKEGANTYDVTVSQNSVTVSNHPFRQAILSIIASLFCCLIAGPIILVFFVIINVIDLIKAISYVAKNKENQQA